ncbi:hypothetical protein C823_000692 [Eubacterium plexicaudatum ASF492]|uniref:DUF4825 domain-containing protein n=1 Tax=Eubacterium plexicaudatum ASF492 TaxID=1235802 RepID=N2A3U6_9FIRM|nr:hypothetical protein C823_000692 [Eubacterium plexicaudatum ASF492]
MKKKLIALMLAACVLASGCGNGDSGKENFNEANTNTKDTETQTDFAVDEKKLEEDGYTDIACIAYAKIKEEKGNQTLYLVCKKNEPEQNIYLWSQMVSNIESISSYSITWDGKEYLIDAESEDMETEEDMLALLPPGWREIFKEMQSKGDGADSIVSKADAENIDRAVESFASKYLEDGELEVISKREYTIDEDSISLSITKRGEKVSLEVDGNAKTEDKAYLMYAAILVDFQNLKSEFYECSAKISYDNLYVLHLQYNTSTVISGLNSDGEFVMDVPDWIDKDMDNLNTPKEKAESYLLEVENALQDFGKSSGYAMGYLLNK